MILRDSTTRAEEKKNSQSLDCDASDAQAGAEGAADGCGREEAKERAQFLITV